MNTTFTSVILCSLVCFLKKKKKKIWNLFFKKDKKKTIQKDIVRKASEDNFQKQKTKNEMGPLRIPYWKDKEPNKGL